MPAFTSITDTLKKLPAGKCLFAAQRGLVHRDIDKLPPENTLSAIDASAKAGADFFETDIQCTRDGAFVLAHDPEISRELNGTGPVASHTLAELKALRKKRSDGSLSLDPIATFAEALERARGKIFIRSDVRPHALPHLDELWDLLLHRGMTDAVMFRIPCEDVDAATNHAPAAMLAHPTLLLLQVDSPKEYRRIRAIQPESHCIEVAITNAARLDDRRLALVKTLAQLDETVSVHAWDKSSLAQLRDAGARIFQTDNFNELSS